MAVIPMKRVLICGLKKDRKGILEALQRLGSFEVVDEKPPSRDFIIPDTLSSQGTFSKACEASENALETLSRFVPCSSGLFDSLKGRKEISSELYYKYVAEAEEIIRIANRIVHLGKTIDEEKAEIIKAELLLESLAPWLSLSVPLNFKGTKKTAVLTGTFPKGTSRDKILSDYAKICGQRGVDAPIDISFINESEARTCVMIICLKKHKDFVEGALREGGFSYPSNSFALTPAEEKTALKAEIKRASETILEAQNEIKGYSGMGSALRFLSDYYAMRLDKYKVLSKTANLKRTFFIKGYVPLPDCERLKALLSVRYNAVVEVEDIKDGDAPVLLKNNGFASPVEAIVESYSLPGKGEIDPSGIMAVFYYFLFGLMLSDFAYGILIVSGCALALLKFKGMEDGMKKTLKMFMYCGISTAFWGLVFGSCFGDAVTVIGNTFFGVDIAFKPLWFEPIDKPIKMLLFSFAIGIVHLFTGLFMKLYSYIKHRQYKSALYDVVFRYLLVGGGIVYLLSADMFKSMAGLTYAMPPIVPQIAAWCAAVGAIGIALTNGRSSENPAKRVAKGLYELYNVTGYLSDILSYSRLLALGLATGVIAQVFNKIGSMGGSSFLGIILFIIVFIIGHTVNLLINLLGAYVHTNRLQFVEFFGKFYEGGGRKYKPFKANTKYYKIKEDI